MRSYLPAKDGALLDWARNFSIRVSQDYQQLNLSQSQAQGLAGLYAAYEAAYTAAVTPETRTKGTIVAKDDAKKALIVFVRPLVTTIQGNVNVTNQQKIDLGLTVRDAEPSPIGPPANPPVLTIAATMGRTVKLRLRDLKNPDRRAKPVGVSGAAVFSYVGAEAPADISQWVFKGNTSLTTIDVEFPPTIAPGTQVWFTAFWFNPRKQSGPSAAPVSTYISGAVSMAA